MENENTKFFLLEDIKNNNNFEQYRSTLKRKLTSFPELKKDIITIQLILNLILYKSYLLNNEQDIRILNNKLILLLKNHDAFRYFLYNNHIDDKTLLKIIPGLKYEQIIKNNIIYKEGDESLKMYFILKGRVTIAKNTNKLTVLKELKENDNFGQWDIIYHRKRKLTYNAKENCHIISIDKSFIKKYLLDKIKKGEDEINSFVTKFLKKYGITAFYRIERIIHNLKYLFLRNDEIIYNEGDIDKNIYLIYNGEAKLMKKIRNGEFNFIENLNENILTIQKKAEKINYNEIFLNEKDEILNQNKIKKDKMINEKSEYKTLAILGKGSAAGLEMSTGIVNKKYTLVANSDYTIIIKIELKYIKENLRHFMINLLPSFIQSEKDIHSRIKKMKHIENYIIPLNCQINKKNKNEYINIFDNNKIFINEIKKINNKLDVNEGGFIKMNDFNINLNIEKNKLKDKLTENNKKYYELNYIIKQNQLKEEINDKYKEVKMIQTPYIIKINTKRNNDMNKKEKKINLLKNFSERYYAEKTLKNFAKIIENYERRNNFNIYSSPMVKTEINYNKNKNSKDETHLLKEVIIINRKKPNNSMKEYFDKSKSYIRNRKYKRLNKKLLLKNLNIYKAFDDKDEDNIYIINKNILRDLFEKNMIKKERNNTYKKSNTERRILYYNTGMYDMPFVSHFNSNNYKKVNL